jgi:DNA-binding transcriptional ArsR family regulator
MRTKIMISLMEKPKNANQLCVDLNVNYRTVDHHLKVLRENGLVTVMGNAYGRTYFPGSVMERNFEMFMEIVRKSGNLEGGT